MYLIGDIFSLIWNITGTIILAPYQLSQVTATHLEIGHPEISFMGAQFSDELQIFD